MTPQARQLFAKALERDPRNGAALFYGAMALKQDGRKEEAAGIWQNLWSSTPEPRLREIIEAELKEVGAAPPTPSAQ